MLSEEPREEGGAKLSTQLWHPAQTVAEHLLSSSECAALIHSFSFEKTKTPKQNTYQVRRGNSKIALTAYCIFLPTFQVWIYLSYFDLYCTKYKAVNLWDQTAHSRTWKEYDDRIKQGICNSKGNHNELSGIIHFIHATEVAQKSIKHTATTELLRQYHMHKKLLLWF